MVADITSQVLDALDYIQWRGRVYLNIEPSNVIVCSGRSLGKTLQVIFNYNDHSDSDSLAGY
jgi:hypothetical protein